MKAARKTTTTHITMSPDFQTKYNTTLTTCECPAQGHNPAEPCKHRQVLSLKYSLKSAMQRNAKRFPLASLTTIKLDVLYSSLDYHQQNWLANGQRKDIIALEYISNCIQRIEVAAGMDVSLPVLVRLNTWLKHYYCGRTTIAA